MPLDAGKIGELKHLGATINSERDELYPTAASNENLYFSTENGSNDYDVMVSKLTNNIFQKPESVGDSVNTKAIEYDAYIAPDETFDYTARHYLLCQ